jgi:predicted lactoylglutathione lyase
MNHLRIKNVMAFLPSRDFQLSSWFYEEFGFTKAGATDNAAQFMLGDYGF